MDECFLRRSLLPIFTRPASQRNLQLDRKATDALRSSFLLRTRRQKCDKLNLVQKTANEEGWQLFCAHYRNCSRKAGS
jgi:hypothetical protein